VQNRGGYLSRKSQRTRSIVSDPGATGRSSSDSGRVQVEPDDPIRLSSTTIKSAWTGDARGAELDVKQVQTYAGDVLGTRFDRRDTVGVIPIERNVEALILCAATVICEVPAPCDASLPAFAHLVALAS
jgi:hypothetical protein